MRLAMNAILLIIALFQANLNARADFIISIDEAVHKNDLGGFDYIYTLENEQISDSGVVVFSANIYEEANLNAIFGPVGWNIGYAPGNSAVTWETTDFESLISPGNSAVFGFSSIFGPGSSNYAVQGLNLTTFELPSVLGQTLAPVAVAVVPEPSTATLLCIGTIAAVAARGCSLRRWFHDSLGSSKPTDSCS